ncbi:uncharacterized protein HMPREF1120_07118 [Exophiala dermatitidis NIH/UT8656]|uniref:Uncharacterized protein n=1 Tax=Exophiala dermatitidis (strain ATCC 34100 / CBS 525.76 / NIH/UT8656) TaxID=858893 RepID=H6C5X3_EXODN|nr:uncharacterized protein HMPREF1120_07118 [Exophiala dermatitidis NIH/UT8656]EHY59119.1 hypothetical protein HMPREF1120_07118 [Exophiala dermatitidis NIH/UT8656]
MMGWGLQPEHASGPARPRKEGEGRGQTLVSPGLDGLGRAPVVHLMLARSARWKLSRGNCERWAKWLIIGCAISRRLRSFVILDELEGSNDTVSRLPASHERDRAASLSLVIVALTVWYYRLYI